MRVTLFLFILLNTLFIRSQNRLGKPFITTELNLTLGINEYYEIGNSEETGTLLEPAALFFRLGFGYEIQERIAISVNSGYDFHFNYDVDAFPTYFGLKYNYIKNENNAYFIEGRYGKMWTPSRNYADGKYYGVGLGIKVEGESKTPDMYFRIDYHKKAVFGFTDNKLESISFGFGISLL